MIFFETDLPFTFVFLPSSLIDLPVLPLDDFVADTRMSSVIGVITVPILDTTFGVVILRDAVSGMKVEVTGARMVDSNAATVLNERGISLT